LLGDLNAEPHEKSVQLLTAEEGGFRDAWVETHPPLVNDELEDDLVGQEGEDEQEKRKRRKKAKKARARRKRKELLASYTFPTCNPVKRIDYVLYRGFPLPPAEVRRCGLEATEDTKNLPSPGGGMLEPGGPVFASDHMGLLAEFGV
jgi:endonuclease/exonuclease/phosphatase family metal-dependent hydrolase